MSGASCPEPGLEEAERKRKCDIEYLANEKLHQRFTLAPSTVTNRRTETRVTYSDVGPRVKDGALNKAIILFCGGMSNGRWMGPSFDKMADLLGVRVISVDRPGMGGTAKVDLEYRVQTWLEIVPALLDHLRVKHVTLVSHSAGTIYLLNTVLHHRHVLHPRKPYVALLAPWIYGADTDSRRIALTRLIPVCVLGNLHRLDNMNHSIVQPLLRPVLDFSGQWVSRLRKLSSYPESLPDRDSFNTESHGSSISEFEESDEDMLERQRIGALTSKYERAENNSGNSHDALLCLQRPKNYWGSWTNYNILVPRLAAQEESLAPDSVVEEGQEGSQTGEKLAVEVFYASSDRFNGRKGAVWFNECWNEQARGGFIEFKSQVVQDRDHDNMIYAGPGVYPMDSIFRKVVALSA